MRAEDYLRGAPVRTHWIGSIWFCIRFDKKKFYAYEQQYIHTTLHATGIRSHLDYASSAWCLYKIGDIEDIEKVQKRPTKLVIELKHLIETAESSYIKI